MMGDSMALPRKKTCGDCAFFKRCSWLIGAKGKETQCDWSPSRFMAAVDAEAK